MKKMLFALAAAAVLVGAGASPARAQTSQVAIIKAPVRFVVSDHLLPAGTYRISWDASDGTVMEIESLDGKTGAVFFATEPAIRPSSRVNDVSVQFKTYRGQYFLSQINVPGEGARPLILNDASMGEMLAKLNLLPAEPALGASAR